MPMFSPKLNYFSNYRQINETKTLDSRSKLVSGFKSFNLMKDDWFKIPQKLASLWGGYNLENFKIKGYKYVFEDKVRLGLVSFIVASNTWFLVRFTHSFFMIWRMKLWYYSSELVLHFLSYQGNHDIKLKYYLCPQFKASYQMTEQKISSRSLWYCGMSK